MKRNSDAKEKWWASDPLFPAPAQHIQNSSNGASTKMESHGGHWAERRAAPPHLWAASGTYHCHIVVAFQPSLFASSPCQTRSSMEHPSHKSPRRISASRSIIFITRTQNRFRGNCGQLASKGISTYKWIMDCDWVKNVEEAYLTCTPARWISD